jgi:vacuolar-type H+-ATPase catalytic subunit A/Vma1
LYEWFVKAGDSFKTGDVIGQYIQTSTIQRKKLSFPYGGTILSISMKGAACQGSALMNLAVNYDYKQEN